MADTRFPTFNEGDRVPRVEGEDVDRLLQLAGVFSRDPCAPARDPPLWQEARRRAQEVLVNALRLQAAQAIVGAPRANPHAAKRIHRQMEEALDARAVSIYRQLDPRFAEVEERGKAAVDESIREFARIVRANRQALLNLSEIPKRYAFVYQPLSPATHDESLSLDRDEWHALWRRAAQAIVEDLEGMKAVLIKRFRVPDDGRPPVPPASAGREPSSAGAAAGETRTVVTERRPLANRDQVFLCYSHADERWLTELLKMMAPLVSNETVSVWWDGKIKPTQKWREEIDRALAVAKVGVLLVSPDFLVSDFINRRELPYLLEAAEKNQVRLTWMLLKSCLYKETPIAEHQALHDLARPLAGLTQGKRDKVLAQICEKIAELVKSDNAHVP